jgi:hypothetical protein
VSNFHPRTLVLIGVLVTVTVFLLILAVWLSGGKKTGPAVTRQTEEKTVVEKTATVYFLPETLNLSQSTTSSATVDIYADSGRGSITGVQAGIDYDPTVITNVNLLPPDDQTSLFGPAGSYNTLFTDTKTPGKISFAIGILPNGNPAKGKGSIGKITFTVNKSKPSTEILFNTETVVTTQNVKESVLDYTTSITIQLQSVAATSE